MANSGGTRIYPNNINTQPRNWCVNIICDIILQFMGSFSLRYLMDLQFIMHQRLHQGQYSLDHLCHGTNFLKYSLFQYSIKNRVISHYLLQLCFWRASQGKPWARNTSFLHRFPSHTADIWSSVELVAKPLDPFLVREKNLHPTWTGWRLLRAPVQGAM